MVYSEENSTFIDRVLLRIPEYDKSLISVDEELCTNTNYRIFIVNNDIWGGSPDIHIIAYKRTTKSLSFLRSSLLLNSIKVEYNLDTIEAHCIDQALFNDIYFIQDSSSDYLTEKFASLLANDSDTTKFKKIKTQTDIEELIKRNRVLNNYIKMDEVSFDKLNTSFPLGPNESVYWYSDRGLIKFILHRNDNSVIFQTEALGYLGIEFIPI